MIAMLVRRLIRTAFGGSGWRSSPLGASIGGRIALLFVSTANLHFLSLLAGAKYEVGAIKQAVDDIGLIFDAIVCHLAFAIVANDEQDNPRIRRSVQILTMMAGR